MLRGDVSVALAPIAANTLKKSSSPACLHWKSKKAAVEMARAMVQANATKKTASITTSFMISAGDNASRKRMRPRTVKRTPEEEARYKAQQLERERENRRQAAYQRLQARRELQVKKKKEHKKQKEEEEAQGSREASGKQDVDSDSDDESEASDVSNCSESDEANEKAILALEVQIQPSVDEVEDSPRTDRSESDDGGNDARKEFEDNGKLHDAKDEDLEAPEYSASSIDAEEKEIDDKDVSLQETEKPESTSEAEVKQQQLDYEEAIAFDLQRFMASRAAAKFEQLRAEKETREGVNTSKPRVERQTLLVWQKVNHFQHAKALTQYVSFVQAFQERSERLKRSGFSEAKNIWIMKPVALSRGRGISLVNDLSQVIYGEQVIIQEYIAAPRLLDGFKFDLRLYVLVTSFNPLEAFLYNEGFVRLCTRPYEASDISNIFVHLTNSSIQKDNEEAIAGSANPIASALKEEEKTEASQKDAGGTKTTLAYLWRRLAAEGVNVEKVKRSIEEVVLKALLCGEDQIPFQVNSFDLLGYDILLDDDLRPWLIEINSSPSMARDNELDYQVKDAMMLDTLRVVDPLHFDRAKLAEVIARRQRDQEHEKRRPHAHTRHPRETEELAARQLNEDLTAILRGEVPRAYGEIPENIGNYRRLCPHTTIYNQLVKLKRSCLRKA
ncbi:hypothetical protein JG687_00018973 [Phytophthora cactorum]|uniref:Uncharacterized protein n=1 Tax=Phytophthora cactorum TaxID=29920 RepID=A0A8T1TKJ1_9STRA|nr:hypothetical protein JG687_00018973 [Phytophthora cactorum]